MKRIADLPAPLKALALKNQERQGKQPNENLFINDGPQYGNFLWDKAPEGYRFWTLVWLGDFEGAKKIHNYEAVAELKAAITAAKKPVAKKAAPKVAKPVKKSAPKATAKKPATKKIDPKKLNM